MSSRELVFQQQQAKLQHTITRLQQQLEQERKQFVDHQTRSQQQREADLVALAQEREQLRQKRYERRPSHQQTVNLVRIY